ncbi:MAG: hypothetical protein AAFR16_02295 [Pseudomonadota bacterium]
MAAAAVFAPQIAREIASERRFNGVGLVDVANLAAMFVAAEANAAPLGQGLARGGSGRGGRPAQAPRSSPKSGA